MAVPFYEKIIIQYTIFRVELVNLVWLLWPVCGVRYLLAYNDLFYDLYWIYNLYYNV